MQPCCRFLNDLRLRAATAPSCLLSTPVFRAATQSACSFHTVICDRHSHIMTGIVIAPSHPSEESVCPCQTQQVSPTLSSWRPFSTVPCVQAFTSSDIFQCMAESVLTVDAQNTSLAVFCSSSSERSSAINSSRPTNSWQRNPKPRPRGIRLNLECSRLNPSVCMLL